MLKFITHYLTHYFPTTPNKQLKSTGNSLASIER